MRPTGGFYAVDRLRGACCRQGMALHASGVDAYTAYTARRPPLGRTKTHMVCVDGLLPHFPA
jgi:hypothetical protein